MLIGCVHQVTALEQELDDVQLKRLEYDERIEEESQSQGRDMHLEESQVPSHSPSP